MENLLTITLEAHNAARNHHRRYEIAIGRDLFGEWTVCLRYGRVGRGGQEIRHAGRDLAPLQRIVGQTLRRRFSAPKRIGCEYRLTELSTADDGWVASWLPPVFQQQLKHASPTVA